MAPRTVGVEREPRGTRDHGVLAWLRLARVFQKIERASSEHLREWGLSMAQFDLLAQVGSAEGMTQQELAQALLVTKGNVCQLLDRMERDGLLKRCQAGRANRLVLTDEGRRLYAEVIPAHEALIERLFSHLSTEEQVHLLGALRKLDHGLRERDHPGVKNMAVNVETKTTWQIDPAHTLVEFSAKHMMFTTVKGRFGTLSGTIVEDNSDFTKSIVEATIDTSSIATGDAQRDGHLKSPDFLHVEDHPQITFKSTRIEPKGSDRFSVTGDLTIRGTTRPVTLDVTRNGVGTTPFGTQVAGFSADTQISRKDFGLTWNVALEAGGVLVSDNVKISLEVQAVKQG